MSFVLHRNFDDYKYELFYEGVVIARYDLLADAVSDAEKRAKNNVESLFVTKACVSDWYLGFPLDSAQKTVAFFSPEGIKEETQKQYRFIEGPFETEDQARVALRKISGQSL